MRKQTRLQRFWGWVQANPLIANPIIVGFYGVVTFLTLETTDIWSPATYKQALTVLILALLSAAKNFLESKTS